MSLLSKNSATFLLRSRIETGSSLPGNVHTHLAVFARVSLNLLIPVKMCVSMPKTIKQKMLRQILPIYNKQVKLIDVAKVCSYSQRSLERWLSACQKHGEQRLELSELTLGKIKNSPSRAISCVLSQTVNEVRTGVCMFPLPNNIKSDSSNRWNDSIINKRVNYLSKIKFKFP